MSKSKLLFVVLSLLVLQAFTLECEGFEEYTTKFQKKYKNEEEKQHRKEIFCQNLQLLQREREHNPTCQFEVNKFTDRTQQEMARNGLKQGQINSEKQSNVPENKVKSGSYKNWAEEGKVTSVKNQGSCGSCTAFAAAACAESHLIIKEKYTNTTIDLSDQLILDCTDTTCDGGYTEDTMAYLMNPQTTEQENPYTEINNPSSSFCSGIDDGIDIADSHEDYYDVSDSLIMDLLDDGPAAVNLVGGSWGGYSSGVYSCYFPGNVDHAVLLVGYGTQDGEDYWLLKNQWGQDWGDNGYIKINRDRTNNKNCRIGRAVFTLSGPAMLFKGMLLLVLALFLY